MNSLPHQPGGSVADAMQLWRTGRHHDAEHLCEMLTRTASGTVQTDALSLLAEIYNATRRTRQELVSLRQLSEMKRGDASVWRRRGNAELALGELAEAVSSYERGVSIEPGNVRGHNNLGQALMRLGRHAEAAASYRAALELAPSYALAHNNLGIARYELGEVDTALDSYRRALSLDPALAEAHHNCGNALLKLDRPEEALECYRQALRLKPDSLQVLQGLADALIRLRRFEEALAIQERGLQSDPQNARLLTGAANVLMELQRPREALSFRERALRLEPGNAEAQNNRAVALNELGRCPEALACCDRALALRSDFPEALATRARALQELRRYDEARMACEQALQLRPDFLLALGTLAELLDAMGEREAAQQYLRRVLELEPDRADARNMLLMSRIPSIPSSADEVAAARAAFPEHFAEFERWVRDNPQVEETSIVGSSTPFFLAYQDSCNRELLSRHGGLCCELMSRWQQRKALTAPLRNAPRASRKLRVGIVSAHIRDHSVYRALVRGWLEQLDRERFEIGVIHLGIDVDGDTSNARNHASFFIDGARPLRQWVDAIRSASPDVLIFPEIGMNAITVQLASLRLAPYQLAAWGHPETTGLPTIDYYLSASCFEPPQAQENYSERLVPLPNLGCYYEPYGLPPAPVDMARLGVSTDRPIFLCPGMPFKYAPQYDAVFATLAQRLGRCQFVFFDAPVPGLTQRLRRRLSAVFQERRLDPDEYLVFVPWQPAAGFFGLMQRADVMLDTIGFSGFNTAMQAIECGLPLVAFEARFMRGRLGSGIANKAGLPDLVARTTDEYVELSVRLATDEPFRSDVRRRIEAARGALFRDREAIDGLARFLGELH
jgi:protein O-GlcNAc transferase